MKILVTGAAGFMGSHLCEVLIKKGHEVYGIDNFFRGKKTNLPTSSNFHFAELDLIDQFETKNYISLIKPQIVIHYAAINGTKYFYDIPFKVCNDNVLMTQNLLNSLKESVDLFVYASSSEVYGPSPITPTSELEPIILHATSDRDSYASSKAIGEFLTRLWAREKGKSFLILRPFNTYGTRMATNGYGQVIPEFIERIRSNEDFYLFGTGNQTRSFCNVIDHVNIVSELIFKAKNEVLNIGYDEEVTILQLAELIHFQLNKKFQPMFKPAWENDTKWRKPDLSKIKNYVGDWKFIGLNDGISQLLNF
jgi:dTDP-glucose 4,6-dehydratase